MCKKCFTQGAKQLIMKNRVIWVIPLPRKIFPIMQLYTMQIKFKSNETHQSNPPLTQNVQSCCFARSDWNPLFAFLVLYGNWEVTTNLIVFKSLFRPNFAFMISIETSVKNHHKGKGVFHFHVFNLPYNRCGAGEGKKIYESKRNWSEEVLS